MESADRGIRHPSGKLDQFKDYYNQHRPHSSLAGVPPEEYGGKRSRKLAEITDFDWRSHCNGLFQTPVLARLRIRQGQAADPLVTRYWEEIASMPQPRKGDGC